MNLFMDDESDDESELSHQWRPEMDRKTSSIAEEDLIVFNSDKNILNIREKSFRGPLVVDGRTMVVFIDGSCQNNGRPDAKAAFGRTSTKTKSAVFILNLDIGESYEGLFDVIYPNLIASLASEYRVYRARKPKAATEYLDDAENRSIAILVVDPGVLKKAHVTILEQLKVYIQRGGTVVFMATFSSFISPPDMNYVWRTHWGLNWQCGDYHRTDVFINKNITLQSSYLLVSYSQKALCLKNVARSDCLYLPMPESGTPSNDFLPDRASQTQTPVALTKIDRGRLGYFGDVNNEIGTQKVVLEICRAAAAAAV